jgi:hypothetical protein
MLSNQQFERTRRLALSLAGIELAERHRELLARRSRRFGALDGAGLDSLLRAAEEGETTATQQLTTVVERACGPQRRQPARSLTRSRWH